ncbi:MAG: IPT/TIG domain-containing protein [Candidatus Eremiobacteraeota bacterium]|nr:IPT/TIG domain-containing protein [Candidatus Eremiobacteraeota bacterium]
MKTKMRYLAIILVIALGTGCSGGGGDTTTWGGTSQGVVASPKVTSISPASLATSLPITIAGLNFGTMTTGTTTANNYVRFESTTPMGVSANAGSHISWADQQIVCTVPTGLTAGAQYVIIVNVLTTNGQYSSSSVPSTENTGIVTQ